MFKHLTAPFMLIAFCLGVMVSCSEKEYPTEGGQSEEKETTYTFNFDIDEVPILSAQTELIVNGKKEESGEEAVKPLTRSIKFTVPQSGNYPSVSLEEGSTIDVYLLLYPSVTGYYGNKIFYSKNTVKLIVKGGKLHMAHRQVEFVGGNYTVGRREKQLTFNGEMAFNNKNNWVLSAIYAPGGTFNNGELAFEATMPNRFLKAGEKLTVGTDIKIPFVLGTVNGNTRSIGVALEMDWDKTKVAEYNTGSSEAAKTENYTFRLKKGVNYGFYPIGKLFCINFKNNLKEFDKNITLIDPYWNNTNGDYDKTKKQYEYSVKGVGYRSMNTKGVFKLGSSLDFVATSNEMVTKSFTVPSNQKIELDIQGNETPWLYFWQRNNTTTNEGGKNVSHDLFEIVLNLYNKNIKQEMISKVYSFRTDALKENTQNYKRKELKRELTLSPLYTLGPSFVTLTGNNKTWGQPSLGNDDLGTDNKRGIGRFYTVAEARGLMTPFVLKNPDGNNQIADNLKWVLPSEGVARSVFPPSIEGISNIVRNKYVAKKVEATTTNVIVDGEQITDKAVYYSGEKKDLIDKDLTDQYSLRVYYAIRYIGTKYVSAWRYVEKGRWNAVASSPSIASKLYIQSRALPIHAGMKKVNNGYVYDQAEATKYLKDVIAQNLFWSENPVLNHNTVVGDLRFDVIKRELSLPGDMRVGSLREVGHAFVFFLYPTGGNSINLPGIQVANQQSESMKQISINNLGKAMVLPFLMPGQGIK